MIKIGQGIDQWIDQGPRHSLNDGVIRAANNILDRAGKWCQLSKSADEKAIIEGYSDSLCREVVNLTSEIALLEGGLTQGAMLVSLRRVIEAAEILGTLTERSFFTEQRRVAVVKQKSRRQTEPARSARSTQTNIHHRDLDGLIGGILGKDSGLSDAAVIRSVKKKIGGINAGQSAKLKTGIRIKTPSDRTISRRIKRWREAASSVGHTEQSVQPN